MQQTARGGRVSREDELRSERTHRGRSRPTFRFPICKTKGVRMADRSRRGRILLPGRASEDRRCDVSSDPGVDLPPSQLVLVKPGTQKLTIKGRAGMYEKNRRDRNEVVSPIVTSTRRMIAVYPSWWRTAPPQKDLTPVELASTIVPSTYCALTIS